MPRATPIRREKVIDERGNITELAIWQVPPTGQNQAGIRYRLAEPLLADFTADVRRATGDATWPGR